MRTLSGFVVSLLLANGLFAQHRGGIGNPHPFAQGTFSSVVFAGGTGFHQ
jgi:cellobiose-specific phosphotransferase system component IIC